MTDEELEPFPEGSCEICGRFGTVAVHARKYTGTGLSGETTFWRGRACRDCGTAQYRAGQEHCLTRGWSGLLPLVVNPLRIAQNAVGLWRMRSAPEPVEPAIEPPFDPGPPVLARPGTRVGLIVPAVLLVVVLGAVVAFAVSRGDDGAPTFAVGTCLDLPEGADAASTTSCRRSHDAEVTGRRQGTGAATGRGLCQGEAERYLGGPLTVLEVETTALAERAAGADLPANVICLIVPSGDAAFTRPMRGTGKEPG